MKASEQPGQASSADEADERRADDLFWHSAVAEFELGPDLEQLEREAHVPGTTQSRIERLEAWLQRMGPVLRITSTGALLLASMGALAMLTLACVRLLMVLAGALPRMLGERPLGLQLAMVHVVVMAVLLVLVFTNARPREPQSPVAQQAWRQFRRGWAMLWSSWLALYAWLTVFWSQDAAQASLWSNLGPPVADLLNVASSAVFFYLFLVLDRPSVKADGLPDRDRTFRRSLLGVSVVCGATAILSILGRLELLGLESFGPLMGSLLVAISMAFFVGRLSDSHLKVRRALLAPLYFYVAIQVLWHLFVMQGTASELANSLALCGALALKVYLYALVTRWMQDGALQRYFDEVAYPRLPSDLDGS